MRFREVARDAQVASNVSPILGKGNSETRATTAAKTVEDGEGDGADRTVRDGAAAERNQVLVQRVRSGV